jgi:hypothetical protein
MPQKNTLYFHSVVEIPRRFNIKISDVPSREEAQFSDL